MKKMLLGLICIFILLIIPLNAITPEEQRYYKSLSEDKGEQREDFETYIYLYVSYSGKEIPEDELDFIKNMTLNSCYNNTVEFNFTNTMKKLPLKPDGYPAELHKNRYSETEGIVESESTVCENGAYCYHDDLPENQLIAVYYIYRDNIYMARIGTNQGKSYILYFLVDNGMVVDIHA